MVRTIQQRQTDYEVGEILVCRKYTKTKSFVCNVNYEYVITEVTDKTISIKEEHEPSTFILPLNLIKTNFIHGYCRTCHSYQGSSINECITIFDWTNNYVSRKWIYTAVTRATELKNVEFYFDERIKDKLQDQDLSRYFESRIRGYIEQDRKANRTIPHDNYIDVYWFLTHLKGVCVSCGKGFDYDLNDYGNFSTDLTANRIDNEFSHELDNIEPMCYCCNRNLSNK